MIDCDCIPIYLTIPNSDHHNPLTESRSQQPPGPPCRGTTRSTASSLCRSSDAADRGVHCCGAGEVGTGWWKDVEKFWEIIATRIGYTCEA